mgnify:CR=1 FL=1
MSEIVTAYEVDMAAINGPKEKLFDAVLAKVTADDNAAEGSSDSSRWKCSRKVVEADLTHDGELKANLLAVGYEVTTKPTIVLAEGLIMYLAENNKDEQLLRDISELVSDNSWLILNYMEVDPTAPKYPGSPSITATRIEEILSEGGWKDFLFNCYGDDVLNYGRFLNNEYEQSKYFSFLVCRK